MDGNQQKLVANILLLGAENVGKSGENIIRMLNSQGKTQYVDLSYLHVN